VGDAARMEARPHPRRMPGALLTWHDGLMLALWRGMRCGHACVHF
jgi:hypothetical protein